MQAAADCIPRIFSPTPGAEISGEVSFVWNDSGWPADSWKLYVGSEPGSYTHHDSGELGGSTHTHSASIPRGTKWVRLHWKVRDNWYYRDSQYL